LGDRIPDDLLARYNKELEKYGLDVLLPVDALPSGRSVYDFTTWQAISLNGSMRGTGRTIAISATPAELNLWLLPPKYLDCVIKLLLIALIILTFLPNTILRVLLLASSSAPRRVLA